MTISVAPPAYVVLRKLEFYREGRSSKHPANIRQIVPVTGVDLKLLDPWLSRLGLLLVWGEVMEKA